MNETILNFTNGKILVGDTFTNSASFKIQNGVFTAIETNIADNANSIDLMGGYLIPGLIDTQVNGGGGVLFNDDISIDALNKIAKAHLQYGTTSILPTLISSDVPVIEKAIAVVDDAIANKTNGIIGIHIEGPFISKTKKGIHDESVFQSINNAAKAVLKSFKNGKMLLTLAPEENQIADISELDAAGIIISAGHSNANYEQAKAGFNAGIKGVTHLYNAMSPLMHRDPGLVGAALENKDIYIGIILDGHHVHETAAKIAMRAHGTENFMLVTDAMPSVGSANKEFELCGKHIKVVNGVCMDDNGTLAGSDLDMAAALKFAIKTLGVDEIEAIKMATYYPARFLGLENEIGQLKLNSKADFIIMNDDFDVAAAYIAGEKAYSKT